jgi:hypothetical protein
MGALGGLGRCCCNPAALGSLGATTATGQIASKGAGLLASQMVVSQAGASAIAAGMSAAGVGAAAGTVVPIVGTIVGAVVGLLASRLFGHANYAQISMDVSNRLRLAEAYRKVAGAFPGRMYGLPELLQIWYGLIHEGLFPKNCAGSMGGGPSCDANGRPLCNVAACIAGVRNSAGQCPNCGGTEQWAADIFTGVPNVDRGTGVPGGNPLQSLLGAYKAATQQGTTDPVSMANVLISAWGGPDSKFNVKWAYPGNSNNAALTTQLMIDSMDAMAASQNAQTPVTYGSGIEPLQAAPIVATQPVSPTAAAPAASPVAAAPSAASVPVQPPPSGPAPAGSSITPQSGGVLMTPYGTFAFTSTAVPNGAGNFVTVNGAQNGGGTLLKWDGTAVYLQNSFGTWYQWVGFWNQMAGAPVAAATPTSAPTSQVSPLAPVAPAAPPVQQTIFPSLITTPSATPAPGPGAFAPTVVATPPGAIISPIDVGGTTLPTPAPYIPVPTGGGGISYQPPPTGGGAAPVVTGPLAPTTAGLGFDLSNPWMLLLTVAAVGFALARPIGKPSRRKMR